MLVARETFFSMCLRNSFFMCAVTLNQCRMFRFFARLFRRRQPTAPVQISIPPSPPPSPPPSRPPPVRQTRRYFAQRPLPPIPEEQDLLPGMADGLGANGSYNHLSRDRRAPSSYQRLFQHSNASYFHGAISRQCAEERLAGQTAGTFLVREKTPGEKYAVSVVIDRSGAVGHFLIRRVRRIDGKPMPFFSFRLQEIPSAHSVDEVIAVVSREAPAYGWPVLTKPIGPYISYSPAHAATYSEMIL